MCIDCMELLNLLIEKCYGMDNFLNKALKNISNPQLRIFLEKSSQLFRDIGDQFFILVVNHKDSFGSEKLRNFNSNPWVHTNQLKTLRENFQLFEITKDAIGQAIDDFMNAKERLALPDKHAKVFHNGITQLRNHLDNFPD